MKSRELIAKYLSGGLNEEERFELEKRALDDEFLDSAWEGYQLHHTSDKRQVIPALEERLAQYAKKKTPVFTLRKYWPIAAAASVAIMVGASFFFNPPSTSISEPSIVAMDNVDLDDDIAPRITFESEEAEVAAVATENPTVSSVTIERPSSSAPTTAPTVAEAPSKTFAKAKETAASQTNPAFVASEEVEVEVAENEPVEKAIISLNQEALSAPIAIAEETQDKESKISRLKKRESLSLADDNSARGLAVVDKTASSANRTIALSTTPDTATASPSMGWEAFQRHLCDDTTLTKDGLFMRGIKSPVVVPVEFELDNYSLPTNVKVLSYPQSDKYVSDEAVRLIRTSGKWSTRKPGVAIRYTIPMCIPE